MVYVVLCMINYLCCIVSVSLFYGMPLRVCFIWCCFVCLASFVMVLLVCVSIVMVLFVSFLLVCVGLLSCVLVSFVLDAFVWVSFVLFCLFDVFRGCVVCPCSFGLCLRVVLFCDVFA